MMDPARLVHQDTTHQNQGLLFVFNAPVDPTRMPNKHHAHHVLQEAFPQMAHVSPVKLIHILLWLVHALAYHVDLEQKSTQLQDKQRVGFVLLVATLLMMALANLVLLEPIATFLEHITALIVDVVTHQLLHLRAAHPV